MAPVNQKRSETPRRAWAVRYYRAADGNQPADGWKDFKDRMNADPRRPPSAIGRTVSRA
jgi:hypothetical protein